MNRVQEAIASVVGLTDEFSSLRHNLEETTGTLEHLIADNALLQRQIEDLDYLNLFDISSVVDIIPPQQRQNVINRLRRLRQENPLAKQAVRLTVRFTLGKGLQYTVAAEEEPTTLEIPEIPGLLPKKSPPTVKTDEEEEEEENELAIIVKSFWNDPDNQRVLTSHKAMKEWLDDCYTDGERFFACFTSGVAPYVKLADLPADEISQIIYHPDNRRVPLYYKRTFQEQKYTDDGGLTPAGEPQTLYYLDYGITPEQLEASKNRVKISSKKLAPEDIRIFHSMPNPLLGKAGKRGVSELYASREWFRVFKEFMEDRAAINAAATSVAFKRKVKGGPTSVAQFKGKLGDLTLGYDNPDNTNELRKLTKPTAGMIYDSNPAVDLEWMKTDTGAVNAKEDARMLLMAAGAGVGTNLPYFGEGGDANLATAQAMELPMVKSYEDWQEFVNQELLSLVGYVISLAISPEEAAESLERIAFHFPPIISQDVVKYMTAWTQMVTAVAPGNQVVHMEAIRGALSVMGVPNIDRLMPLVKDEEERVQAEKQAQKAALLTNLATPQTGSNGKGVGDSTPGAGYHSKPPARGMSPDLVRVARGKVPTERRGPRPV